MKISIITTTFNGAATIRDCLESVKGQTHADIEHVVVDAASTDGTQGILEEFKDRWQSSVGSRQEGVKRGSRFAVQGSREFRGHVTSTCPRNFSFKVVSEPDNGIYDGMNKGLRLATGDVVGILNADDFFSSADVLAKVARVFEDESVDSCYGDLVYIADGNDGLRFKVQGSGEKTKTDEFKVIRYWRSGEFAPRKFYWGWMPPHPTFFVRRSVYEKYGGFNLDLGTAADYELMLRFLLKHRVSTAYLPEILIRMRSGGASNATLAKRIKANVMDRKAWEVNGLKPLPWTLLLKPLRKVGQWVSKPEVLK